MFRPITTLTALFLCLPAAAFAAGGDISTPPRAPECKDGQVMDAATRTCVDAVDSRLDDGERLDAVRQYAYAGDLGAARAVLDAMNDQGADGVLTYRGFTARKGGDIGAAMGWYAAALVANPDNILARSYKGQGHVEAGEIVQARSELMEIRMRGGQGTWAEQSLRMAIETGRGNSY
ncbi:hypothetical protein KUH32_15945 [Thalassococcus sp. CAU 1522]|uniref:Sel1 repeat family protein n=1 Tax=Thalassococcus arenae TaxID=2851652 RepID=A0ABS6NB66_9RHOB|nr:hypothetical protein [Thalassococcus arenae]MBV2361257.1 hypothetical protein [Thalassococcus arenae]